MRKSAVLFALAALCVFTLYTNDLVAQEKTTPEQTQEQMQAKPSPWRSDLSNATITGTLVDLASYMRKGEGTNGHSDAVKRDQGAAQRPEKSDDAEANGHETKDHDMKNGGTKTGDAKTPGVPSGMAAMGSAEHARAGIPVAIMDEKNEIHVLAVAAPEYAEYVGKQLRLSGVADKKAHVFIPQKLEIQDEAGKWSEKKLPRSTM